MRHAFASQLLLFHYRHSWACIQHAHHKAGFPSHAQSEQNDHKTSTAHWWQCDKNGASFDSERAEHLSIAHPTAGACFEWKMPMMTPSGSSCIQELILSVLGYEGLPVGHASRSPAALLSSAISQADAASLLRGSCCCLPSRLQTLTEKFRNVEYSSHHAQLSLLAVACFRLFRTANACTFTTEHLEDPFHALQEQVCVQCSLLSCVMLSNASCRVLCSLPSAPIASSAARTGSRPRLGRFISFQLMERTPLGLSGLLSTWWLHWPSSASLSVSRCSQQSLHPLPSAKPRPWERM